MFRVFTSFSVYNFYHSLDVWKVIVDSDEFWKFYEKYYLLHGDSAPPTLFLKNLEALFLKPFQREPSPFYYHTKNPEVVGACYSKFGRIGKTTESEILQQVILRVKKEIEELEEMRVSVPDASSIKKVLKKIHKCFSKLDKFELSEYTPLIILKNDTAEKLRSISVEIYNKHSDTETTILLEQSSKLSVSEAFLDKIESDKNIIKANEEWWQLIDGKFSRIMDLVEANTLE